jgi:hypothetical protein
MSSDIGASFSLFPERAKQTRSSMYCERDEGGRAEGRVSGHSVRRSELY